MTDVYSWVVCSCLPGTEASSAGLGTAPEPAVGGEGVSVPVVPVEPPAEDVTLF